MIALEGNFAYSFMLGVLAAVNPCGFVLLPAYLAYFLGVDAQATERAPLLRALKVSALVSSGFLLVFLVIGTISRLFTQWIETNAKYAGFAVGIGLIAFGVAMLLGWKPSFATPNITVKRDRSLRAMFLFGIAYAVASIGCTIGFLTTAILGSISVHGFASGVVSIVLYGLGMALLVSALTVSTAFARSGLLRLLKRGLPYADRAAGGFILLTGVYLAWYWYVAITERDSLGNVGGNIERWQSTVANFLQRQGAWTLLVIFGLVVVAVGAGSLITRRRTRVSNAPTEQAAARPKSR
jgi:cytochrome c biogenesis protein CcdA